MKPLRILHFDFDDLESPTAGGQAVRTFEINKRLAKKGHQITVITLTYPGAKNKTKEGIKYERAGLMKGPKSYISYMASIPYMIWKHRFDLVIEDNISPFTFGFSPLYTRKPIISQIQCFFAQYSSIKHKFPLWAFEKYGAKIYKNFIVLTKNMESEIRALNKKARIEIIPNGISKIPTLNFFEQNYFLFIGRLDFYQKGLGHLLAAAELLKKSLPDHKIIIAGTGPDEDKLLNVINTKKLNNIECVGQIEGQKKEQLLQNCLALLQPSNFEIFPFTILEAASWGKPTICFKIANLEEIMSQKIGEAVPAFNIQAFAEVAKKIAHNKTLRQTLGQNAHDWAKKHMWDQIVEKQEKFYQTCIDKK